MEEKAKIDRDLTMKAASSFSLRNMAMKNKREKSKNDRASLVIYEDAELNTYPEFDVEGMDAYTFETLLIYLSDILEAQRQRQNTNDVKLRQPQVNQPNEGQQMVDPVGGGG